MPQCILVVDDEPRTRKLLRVSLQAAGYQVVEAVDGVNALEELEGEGVDAILLDLMMPRMDGLEVTRRVRARAEWESIPIIMMTARNDKEMRLRGLDVGVDDFLVKPAERTELMLRLRNLLRIKALHDEVATSAARSEATLSMVLDTVSAGVLIRDGAGGVRANRMATELLGPGWAMAALPACEQPTLWRQEGSEGPRHLLVRTASVRGDDDVGAGMVPMQSVVTTIADVTALKEAQEVAQAQERFLVSTLDALGSHISIIDHMGTIVSVNEAWRRFGRANGLDHPRHGLGMSYFDVIDAAMEGDGEDDARAVGAGIRAVLAGELEAFEHEYPCSRPGEERWFRVVVTRFRGSGPVHAVVAHEDVTTRRFAEQALRASETRFRTLVEQTPMSVAVLSADGHVRFANPALCRLLRVNPDGLIGRPVSSLGQKVAGARLKGDDAEVLLRDVRHVLVGARLERELRIVWPDGRDLVLVATAVGIEFDGAPSVLCVASDRTEERSLQAQLSLASRMATVGTMAAGVAHEINNPLSYILTNLQLVDQQLQEACLGTCGMDDMVIEAVRDALYGVERVSDIVKGLRTFSRADDEVLRPVSVGATLRAAAQMASNELRYRATLELAIDDEVPGVLANEGQLGQVFLNLLVNAGQCFGDREPTANLVSARVSMSDGMVSCEVTDTGPGIEAEHLGRLFDPFYTTKPVGEGTGLGLAICHKLTSSFGGRIEVESVVGQGTTFRVLLPPTAQVAPGVRRGTTCLPPAIEALRILVVDDEDAIRRALGRVLEPHDVVDVASGEEAVATLTLDPRYDVVLCDMMMRGGSGADLARELAARWPHLLNRMIVMSGGAVDSASRGFLEEMEASGRLLHKPIDPRVLMARILELTEGGP